MLLIELSLSNNLAAGMRVALTCVNPSGAMLIRIKGRPAGLPDPVTDETLASAGLFRRWKLIIKERGTSDA